MCTSKPYKDVQIVGGNHRNGIDKSYGILDGTKREDDRFDLDTDLYHWTKTLRPVQV